MIITDSFHFTKVNPTATISYRELKTSEVREYYFNASDVMLEVANETSLFTKLFGPYPNNEYVYYPTEDNFIWYWEGYWFHVEIKQ